MADTNQAPPEYLPSDPVAFYRAGEDAELLLSVPPPQGAHVLEQLGPPTFRKTTFPIMGFLASLYEHVAASMKGEGGGGDADGATGEGSDSATA